MKILQITNSFYPVVGGQEKVVLDAAKRLVKMGHKVTVLTSNYLIQGKYKKREMFEGIEIIRLKNNLWLKGYGYSGEMCGWLKNNWNTFEIAHCHGYNRYMPEFALKFLHKKIPLVFSPHGFIHTKKNYLFKKIHDLTIGRVIQKANYCTALTKLDFQDYKNLGVKKEKIIELANGVDLNRFSKRNKKEIHGLEKKFGNFALYVGRIHKSKGLSYVLKAIKNIDISLVVVGKDAGYKNELEKLSRELGIQKKIFFVGGVPDDKLVSFYQAAKMFILFSGWEGFGIVAIEAMAAKIPVIASNMGSLPYIIKNKKTGFIIPYQNIAMLRSKIEELLNDKELRKNMGENGNKEVRKYEWKILIKKYERLYQNAKNNI